MVSCALLLFSLSVLAEQAASVDGADAVQEQQGAAALAEPTTTSAGQAESGSLPPQFKKTEYDLAGTIGEVVLYLGVLCALAALAVYLLKRRMVASGALPEKSGSHIRILDRKVLSSRTTVHLLEVSGQQIVLSESEGGQAMLQLPGASSGGEQ